MSAAQQTAARSGIRNRPALLYLSQLVPSKNVREELSDLEPLAKSIREQGLLQPLLVVEHETDPDRFVIIAGHRRAKALALAGHAQAPCTIRFGDQNDRGEHVLMMLVENLQRADLSPVEKARAMGELQEQHGYTGADIARKTGLSPSTVNYHLRLLDLDEDSLALVEEGQVKLGDAHAAVVTARADARKAASTPQRGRPTLAYPAHLKTGHPLAAQVKAACEHTLRPKVGATGCGQCWEDAIRADERARITQVVAP